MNESTVWIDQMSVEEVRESTKGGDDEMKVDEINVDQMPVHVIQHVIFLTERENSKVFIWLGNSVPDHPLRFLE